MDLFNKLNKEKQDRIINAGFTCFSKNGYEKASMADIAKAAQVSKASLFQYFGSKIEFYHYLYELCINMSIKTIDQLQTLPDDFFERLEIIQKMMMKVILKYNGMYDFLYASLSEEASEVTKKINKHPSEYTAVTQRLLLDNINWDKFKPGIDLEMVMNMITWIDQGYTKSIIGQNKSFGELREDIHKYIDLLKQCIYKEEYLHEGD